MRYGKGEYVIAGFNPAKEVLIASLLEGGPALLGLIPSKIIIESVIAFHLSWVDYRTLAVFQVPDD